MSKIISENKEATFNQQNRYDEPIPQHATVGYYARRAREIISKHKPDWTPEDVRDCLTPELATEMGLWPLIKHLPCPDELDPKKDLSFVAWELYPETRNIKAIDLVHTLFRDIVSGSRQKFPKGYFFGWNGTLRARAIFKFFMNDYAIPEFRLTCVKDAYEVFGSNQIDILLKRCNIDRFVHDRYGLPLNFLHSGLGADADDNAYYSMFFGTSQKRNRAAFLLDSDEVRQLNNGNLPTEYVEYLQAQRKNSKILYRP